MKHRAVALLAFLSFLTPYATRADESSKEFVYSTEALLLAHDYNALEGRAQELRRTGARTPGGKLKIHIFYDALSKPIKDEESDNPPADTKAKDEAIKQWVAASPESLTARLAMADLLDRYAWEARTGNSRDKVNPEQWHQFFSNLSEAAGYLKGLNPKDDPEIYILLEEVAIATPKETNFDKFSHWVTGAENSSPRAILDRLYAEEIKDYPIDFTFYKRRSNMLESRWYGTPGELGEYLNSLLSSPGGENGLVAYSFAADSIAPQYGRAMVYAQTGMDWKTISEAYRTREKLYGMNNAAWSAVLYYAAAARDQEGARNAVTHIIQTSGDSQPIFHPDRDIWRNMNDFTMVKAWAMGESYAPFKVKANFVKPGPTSTIQR